MTKEELVEAMRLAFEETINDFINSDTFNAWLDDRFYLFIDEDYEPTDSDYEIMNETIEEFKKKRRVTLTKTVTYALGREE